MFQNKISVVIICRNAAGTIDKALQSAFLLSNDVVVVDSGSTDGTIEKVAQTPATLKQIPWNGYGHAKNLGNKQAANDWILSMDADECLDDTLIQSLKQLDLSDTTIVFAFQRLNYLGQKPIKYGEWGNDIVQRLFNRENASWDASELHEELIKNAPGRIVRVKGVLHHFTTPDIETYKLKLHKYAVLISDKYFQRGKKASWLKRHLSPRANFIVNYIFKGGFLSGKEGLWIARAHMMYTYEKYRLLQNKKHARRDKLVTDQKKPT